MAVFKDERKLSPEYVPERLPFRERELEQLIHYFSSVVRDEKPFHTRVVITGAVGTGKTSLTKLFGMTAEKEGRKNGYNVKYVHINCRKQGTAYAVLAKISEELCIGLPKRGFSIAEMLAAVVKSLNATGTRVILCLDEVEALISKEGAQPLYSLTRAMEDEDGENMVSLIVVLRDPEFLKRFDPSTASSLGNTVIHLEEYGFDQLFEILRYRAGESFREGVISDEVLEFIAQIASDRRDTRYAIELLWRSGKLAELDGSGSITAEHVRKAAASVYPTIRRENLSYLRADERLILLASARPLSGNKTSITSKELYQFYRVVCEEMGFDPYGYTFYREKLQHLQDLGYLRLSIKSSNKGRRTYIYLPGIPATLLEKELIGSFSKEHSTQTLRENEDT
jgi:cell division control protein 6